MSEALSTIQIEQFKRRKEAAELTERITDLGHDLEVHVAETQKAKDKLQQDTEEFGRIETLYEKTVGEASKKIEAAKQKLDQSREMIKKVAMKSNAEFMNTLNQNFDDLKKAQTAVASCEKRKVEAMALLGGLIKNRDDKKSQFNLDFEAGKERILRLDEGIRQNLQKTAENTKELKVVQTRINEAEEIRRRNVIEIEKKQAELELLTQKMEKQQEETNKNSAKLQDLNTKIDDTERHIKFVTDIYEEESKKRMQKRETDLGRIAEEVAKLKEQKAKLVADKTAKEAQIDFDNAETERLKNLARVEEEKKINANAALGKLNERQRECEIKLGNQEQAIAETRQHLEEVAQQRTKIREDMFLMKEDNLDKEEEIRRLQRKANRTQANISDLQNDPIRDELDRARTKHNQLNQEKLALEDDLDELKQNQKTLENELREGTETIYLKKNDNKFKNQMIKIF